MGFKFKSKNANKGKLFEQLIQNYNQMYRELGYGHVKRIEDPGKIFNINGINRIVKVKGTVDFLGALLGLPIALEAKECSEDIWPLRDLKPHQLNDLVGFDKGGSVSFVLLNWVKHSQVWALPIKSIVNFHLENKRKSIAFKNGYREHGFQYIGQLPDYLKFVRLYKKIY